MKTVLFCVGILWITLGTGANASLPLEPAFSKGWVNLNCLNANNSTPNSINALQCNWTGNQKVGEAPVAVTSWTFSTPDLF